MLEMTRHLRLLLIFERIFDREHPAPAMAEQAEVVLVELERLADLLDLLDEARRGPQIVVVRAGRERPEPSWS